MAVIPSARRGTGGVLGAVIANVNLLVGSTVLKPTWHALVTLPQRLLTMLPI